MENNVTTVQPYIGKGLQCHPRNSDCVVDVISTLIEDRGNVLFIDRDSYRHIGVRREYPRAIPSEERRLVVSNYATASDRLNVDFLCKEHILVRPRPGVRRAPEPMWRWRTFVAIHAGGVHLRSFHAALSEDSFDRLRQSGVLDEDADVYDPQRIYRISLPGRRRLPVVSRAWAQPIIMKLDDLFREEVRLFAMQKELHAHLATLAPPSPSRGGDYIRRYRERGTPVGPIEEYASPCAVIRMKMDKPAPVFAGKYEELGYQDTFERIRRVHRALRIIRFRIRAITFAVAEHGSPVFGNDPGKTVRHKNWKADRFITRGEIAGTKLELVTWTGTFERTAV